MANVRQFDYPNVTDDRDTLLSIQLLLNVTIWEDGTIDRIAQIVHEAGYEIVELTD
jgi:hypothetical protein